MFVSELDKFHSVLTNTLTIEQALQTSGVHDLEIHLSEYCSRHRIQGIHYTRAMPEEIKVNGLKVRSGEEIRADFIKLYGNLFSADEITRMKKVWNSYFIPSQTSVRDSRVWFNLVNEPDQKHAYNPLLVNYGGEQVYMPLKQERGIAEKIRTLGAPMVVKCALLPGNLETNAPLRLGRVWLSSYQCLLNRQADQTDVDVFQSIPVAPEDVEICVVML